MKPKSPRRANGEGFGNHQADDKKPPTTSPIQKPTRQARWRARNPKAAWAHSALQSAIRRGLVKRQSCEKCGASPADGHHPDYDRPAHVVWLCRVHHREAHRKPR